MAKKQIKISFSKGTITKNKDGKYIITEVTKDDMTDYNLSEIIDGILGLEGVSVSFGSEDDVPSIEE